MQTKTKNILKKSAIALGAIGALSAVSVAIALKAKKPFKPTFYNYKSYMSDTGREILSSNYDFKEFDTLNEFTKAILTRKALGGIGSDAQAVQLIRRDKLKEIDYLKVFIKDQKNRPNWAKDAQGKNLPYEQYRDKKEYREFQKSLFTDLVWSHMSSYDDVLLTNYDGKKFQEIDGKKRHLYDYFVPYFSQDMVIAYNPFKVVKELINQSVTEEEIQKKLYEFDQKIIDSIYANGFNKGKQHNQKEVIMSDVLKALKSNGFNRFAITDAVRDNMIYGSAYEYDNKDKYFDTNITGKASTIDEPNLYVKLIDNFGKLIKNSLDYSLTDQNINFIGDGQFLLTQLVEPDLDNSKIQAAILYNGDALDAYFSEDNVERSKNGSIRFIRPKSNLLLVDGLVMAKNADVEESDYDKLINTYVEAVFDGLQVDYPEKALEKFEETSSYINFDNVNYTPTVKRLYEYVAQNYFSDLSEFEKSYVTSLYEIKDNYTLFNPATQSEKLKYNVIHKAIEPTDQKTSTNINTYWNKVTKK